MNNLHILTDEQLVKMAQAELLARGGMYAKLYQAQMR